MPHRNPKQIADAIEKSCNEKSHNGHAKCTLRLPREIIEYICQILRERGEQQ